MAVAMVPLARPVWAHAGRQRSRNSDSLDIWLERTRASLQWHDRRITPGFRDASTPSAGINRSERMGSSPLMEAARTRGSEQRAVRAPVHEFELQRSGLTFGSLNRN